MTDRLPRPYPTICWKRVGIWSAAAIAAIGAAHVLDPAAHALIRYDRLPLKNLAELDWQRLLRVLGSLYPWVAIGAVLVLIDRARPVRPLMKDGLSRAAIVLVSVALAGAAAEALKVLIRRLRPPKEPPMELFDYTFRPFVEGWSSSGLGMPSSHSAVAGAGLFALTRLEPRLVPIALVLIPLAALSRVASVAHYLSDAVVGALVGVLIAWLTWRTHLRLFARPTEYDRSPDA
ncbi:MAG: phosphatase PAP2 family protein [Planctomycetota bacterium]